MNEGKSVDEFVIKFDRGRSSCILSSTKREAIVQALQAARAKAHHTKSKQPLERLMKPKDVPGTLTNMALLNLASEDPDLRLASYNLLCALSLVFHFDMNSQLLPVEGASDCKIHLIFIFSSMIKHLPYRPTLVILFQK